MPSINTDRETVGKTRLSGQSSIGAKFSHGLSEVMSIVSNPPPFIREGELVILDGLRPSKTPYKILEGPASL